MLEVDSLHCGYGSLPVLHGLDMRVEPGESVAILGANGAGKSTFLKALAGWLPVQSGEIRWNGEDATTWGPHKMAASGVAFVPQERKVFPTLSVSENLEIAADMHRDGRKRLAESYERFPVLREKRRQSAGSLSGGERQLLAVVSALLLAPRLLALDEPTMGLSPLMAGRIIDLVRSFSQEGLSVVWVVEQDPEAVLRVVDRALVMSNGQFTSSIAGEELSTADLATLLLGNEAP